MNVVIHSVGGRLEASLTDSQVDVNVVDDGPGIPDVEQAMVEGFSTASAEARALGFGAGMGLPNIKRNSDRLRVTSRVGEGTRVSFTVYLQPGATDGPHPISLYASADRCRDCRACLARLPHQAMRVRDGRPSVLEHLCIDCAECIAACPLRRLEHARRVLLAGRPHRQRQDAAGGAAGAAGRLRRRTTRRRRCWRRSAPGLRRRDHLGALRGRRCAAADRPPGCRGDEPHGADRARDRARLPARGQPHRAAVPVAGAAPGALRLALGGGAGRLPRRPAAYVVSCPSQRSALLAWTAQPSAGDGAPRGRYLRPSGAGRPS